MEIFYHIELHTSETLLSNLSREMIDEAKSMSYEFVFKKDEDKRIEKIGLEKGWIYLCICDKSITRKIFSRYLDCLKIFLQPLIDNQNEQLTKYDMKIKRLRHNISSYNAKIQDELENIIPTNTDKINSKEALKAINNEISTDPSKSSIVLLHILKYVKRINAEMDVYNIMNSDKPHMNIMDHPIRKIIDLSIQPFFLDLLEKSVKINRNGTNEIVSIDFPTFSVVLGHIWDNAVKYTMENSEINISYRTLQNNFCVDIEMISILVENDEIENIFTEGLSGKWANNIELNGDGIGMYYAKKLMELNNGTINFIAGKEWTKFNSVPYAKNRIELIIPNACKR